MADRHTGQSTADVRVRPVEKMYPAPDGIRRQVRFGSSATFDAPRESDKVTESLTKIKNTSRMKNRLCIGAVAGALSVALAGGVAVAIYKGVFRISAFGLNGADVKYTADELMSAAGISVGDGLYSFDKAEAERAIIRKYPDISGVTFELVAPSGVNVDVTVASEAFYADLFGETWTLDPAFRVISKTTDEEASAKGLVKLRLPEVTDAIAGSVIAFEDGKIDRYVKKIGSALLSSSLAGRATAVDMRNIYKVDIVVDGKYLVSLGNTDDLEEKLIFTSAVLDDKMFKSVGKAKIDVSKISEASVVTDNLLDLDW